MFWLTELYKTLKLESYESLKYTQLIAHLLATHSTVEKNYYYQKSKIRCIYIIDLQLPWRAFIKTDSAWPRRRILFQAMARSRFSRYRLWGNRQATPRWFRCQSWITKIYWFRMYQADLIRPKQRKHSEQQSKQSIGELKAPNFRNCCKIIGKICFSQQVKFFSKILWKQARYFQNCSILKAKISDFKRLAKFWI